MRMLGRADFSLTHTSSSSTSRAEATRPRTVAHAAPSSQQRPPPSHWPRPSAAAAPVHVTYIGFAGSDRGIAREIGLSAFSLTLVAKTPIALLVLVDDEGLEPALRRAGLPRAARVQHVVRQSVVERFRAFGLATPKHHSGWGGYAKMIVADLLPHDVQHTLVVDADTVC